MNSNVIESLFLSFFFFTSSDPVHSRGCLESAAVVLFGSVGLLLSTGVPVNRTMTTVMLSSDSLCFIHKPTNLLII